MELILDVGVKHKTSTRVRKKTDSCPWLLLQDTTLPLSSAAAVPHAPTLSLSLSFNARVDMVVCAAF